MKLINLSCVNLIWRAAVDVAYGVLTLTAGVKSQNGFVLFIPSRTTLNVNKSGSIIILQYQRVGIYSVADGHTVAEFLDSIT